MAFTLDRTEAAKRLGVSTRTVDRHIQSGRIRTRRVGKKMFLEEDDIEALRLEDPARREDDYIVVVNEEEDNTVETLPAKPKTHEIVSPDVQSAIAEFSRIYNDAQGIISQKNEEIKDLSYKLGKAETELKNSVNAAEYRQTASLLESAKAKNDEDARHFDEKISHLQKEVQKRNSFIIGLMILFVLVIIVSVLFFLFGGRLL